MKEEFVSKDICIVVQGPVNYVDSVIQAYSSYKDNVIISTSGTHIEVIKQLQDNGFTVIQNELMDIPGTHNFNNQVQNTYKGVAKAHQMGFKYIFKIRSDIFIDDVLKLLNKIDYTKTYFSAYHNHNGGYLCEHMLFGSTEFMLSLWNIPVSNSDLAPETQLTARYKEICNNNSLDFIFPILYTYGIQAHWPKYNMYLNQYKNDKLFTYEPI